MMRVVRVTVGKLLAATLLTLCIGLQALEASGRWDRTFQDAGDEAIIITVVLCIGAAVVVAGASRHRVCLSAARSPIIVIRSTQLSLFIPPTCLAFSTSPPLGLRI
jgi:hypothetical protein